MRKTEDLTGRVFDKLTVIGRDKIIDRYWNWHCVCACGNTKSMRGSRLLGGGARSCGCLRGGKVIHGLSGTKEYSAWLTMLDRCCNPKSKAYKNYGGRGIMVCDEWQNDFMSFFNHVGYAPSKEHSIDRIDNDGNYEPGNVRWATALEQSLNTRKSKAIMAGIKETKSGKFSARIVINRQVIHLGTFNTIDEALNARQNTKKLYQEKV